MGFMEDVQRERKAMANAAEKRERERQERQRRDRQWTPEWLPGFVSILESTLGRPRPYRLNGLAIRGWPIEIRHSFGEYIEVWSVSDVTSSSLYSAGQPVTYNTFAEGRGDNEEEWAYIAARTSAYLLELKERPKLSSAGRFAILLPGTRYDRGKVDYNTNP